MADWISTKEAMDILGVGSTTIKRWADDGKLKCNRTAGGHRRFLRASVENVRGNGFAATTADRMKSRQWTEWLAHEGLASIKQRVTDLAAESGDWFAAADFLGSVAEEIGTVWAEGEFSVLDEHFASARLLHAVTSVSSAFEVPNEAPACLLTTIYGESHGLALALAQLCLRSKKIDAVIPGINIPTAELVKHILSGDKEIRIVGLSASRWSSDPVSLASAYRDIASACERQGIELLLGGAGAWPEPVVYGYRCHNFKDLERVLESPDCSGAWPTGSSALRGAADKS